LLLGIAVPRDASADQKPTDDPKDPQKKNLWEKLKGGHDLVESVPTAAVFDGMWSLYVHFATELTNRTWDAPYPWGTIGQYSTRLLYGLTWTGMLALESLAVLVATGGTWEWLGEAGYRSDWMVATDAPVCPRVGAYGGCGLGVGDFAFLSIRPRGSRWWLEAGGGWIQQRIYNDQYKTVAESSWVLTPISATYEVKTDQERAVAFKMYAGPGIYFGLHNGHMHPTLRGERDKNLNAPWHEMYGLDGGIGPGGRVDARVVFGRRIGLDAELVVSPFLLGGPVSGRPSTDISPLDFERGGMSVWRKGLVGVSWNDPKWPIRPVLAAFAAELSERNVFLAGHRGVMLRFDIPLRVPGND
jgi:hypothetical protein